MNCQLDEKEESDGGQTGINGWKICGLFLKHSIENCLATGG